MIGRLWRWLQQPESYLAHRGIGIALLSLMAVALPSLGPHRFLLAAILLLVVVPLAILLEHRFPSEVFGWSQPFFDIIAIILLVHLVPGAWIGAFVVGLVIASISSARVGRRGYLLYGSLNLLLLAGMAVAAIVHHVPGWKLPTAAALATLPCTAFFAYWEHRHVTALRDRAQRVRDLTIIAGGVAHDFRNLLMAISGFADLARVELAEDHPARASVDEVARCARQASILAVQLLALSDKERRPDGELDLFDEIQTLAGLLKTVVPRAVEIVVDARHPIPPVRADRGQIQHVVMNLVLNACEATTRSPSLVEIRLWYEPAESGGNGRVACEVCERSSRIAQKNLPRVFDPFFASRPHGPGLGLAGIQRILSAHDGSLEIQAREGQGSRVCFWLPACVSGMATPVNRGSAPRRKAGRILVVDDEPQIRGVLRRFLARLGYETVAAENGSEAIEQFRNEADTFDAVILDVRMPGMDGWSCSTKMREIRSDIPVIISTAYDPRPPADRPGDLTFLPKPYRFDDLRHALEEAIPQGAVPMAM